MTAKDKVKAIELTVNRFDLETKESFIDLYGKIDAGVDVSSLHEKETDVDDEEEDIAF